MNENIDVLDGWSITADQMLDLTHDLIEEFRSSRKQLDNNYPVWKSKYERSPKDYLSHDARREFFVTCQITLSNANLSYAFMRTSLSQEEWWNRFAGGVRREQATQTLREFALMIKWFSFHQMAVAVEEAMRAIVRAGGHSSFGIKTEDVAKATFAALYQKILKITSLQYIKPLMDVLRETRNTLHTNGVFTPRNGNPVSYLYDGVTFDFQAGKEIKWLDEKASIWLASHINKAMFEIVNASVVSSIPYCPRG